MKVSFFFCFHNLWVLSQFYLAMIANVRKTDLLCPPPLICIRWVATETMSSNCCHFPGRQIKDIQMLLTFVFFTVMPAFMGFLCHFIVKDTYLWPGMTETLITVFIN